MPDVAAGVLVGGCELLVRRGTSGRVDCGTGGRRDPESFRGTAASDGEADAAFAGWDGAKHVSGIGSGIGKFPDTNDDLEHVR